MKNWKKVLSLLLVLAMGISLLAGCGKEESGADTTVPAATQPAGEAGTYTVNIKSAGGMAMGGLDVFLFADEALTDMVDAGKTDDNGTVTFNRPAGTYYITVNGAPKGYQVEKSYTFSGSTANIALTSALITDQTLADLGAGELGLGDVMYDFSYTLPDGTTKMLSEVLAEKEVVLLNFWFAQCGPCGTEFPYMEQAYQMYKEDAAVIALSYIDPAADVALYQSSMGLSFDMAPCATTWPGIFGFNSYPSTVIIDRYGVITLIEVGALTSLRPFTSVFEYFTGDDYVQKVCTNGLDDVVTVVKPTTTMPSSEEIGAVINSGDIQVTYRAEEGDAADTTWPFVITEKNGESCVKASNQMVEASYAILYADVELKAGQAVGFDYLISSERGADAFVVIVDGEDIFQMSGVDEEEKWQTCYPWVADADGTYEVALCYLKDESTDEGDDTVYIKNMRVVAAEDVDTPTYLPRYAATSEDGFTYQYVDVVFNEEDGYYHVGTVDGPLLLANLMGTTDFSEEQSAWSIAYEGAAAEYYEDMVDYFSYANNSSYAGHCTVNEELKQWLELIDEVAGFDEEDDREWMKMCVYYQAYGTDEQLQDPIAGLAPFSAYKAVEGVGVESNYFYYNRIIMPRGMVAEFIPTRSGVYRITSHNDSRDGVEGWIFNENREVLLTYEFDERMFEVDGEVSMVYYMEAGKPYYIDIAYYDVYGEGRIDYDIEYLGATYNLFRRCSPGYYTYDSDATGEAMYHLIAGGIDVVLGSDGYYYHDLGDGKQGSKIYAEFTGLTTIFSNPIMAGSYVNEDGETVEVKGMIDLGGFDFSKTEQDLEILGYLNKHNGDVDATREYLKDYWAEDYDANAELYQIEDVFAGRYHGKGEDLTEAIRAYESKVITSGAQELRGCVAVDAQLAEILQQAMSKYTFEDVDNAWIKLCYYYDYMGR